MSLLDKFNGTEEARQRDELYSNEMKELLIANFKLHLFKVPATSFLKRGDRPRNCVRFADEKHHYILILAADSKRSSPFIIAILNQIAELLMDDTLQETINEAYSFMK